MKIKLDKQLKVWYNLTIQWEFILLYQILYYIVVGELRRANQNLLILRE